MLARTYGTVTGPHRKTDHPHTFPYGASAPATALPGVCRTEVGR